MVYLFRQIGEHYFPNLMIGLSMVRLTWHTAYAPRRDSYLVTDTLAPRASAFSSNRTISITIPPDLAIVVGGSTRLRKRQVECITYSMPSAISLYQLRSRKPPEAMALHFMLRRPFQQEAPASR